MLLSQPAYVIDDGSSTVGYNSTVWVPQSFAKRIIASGLNKLVPFKQLL